jgi:signal transduction histidine kinase
VAELGKLRSKYAGTVSSPVAAPGDGAENGLAPGPEVALPRSLESRRWRSYIPVVLVGLLGIVVTWTVFSEISDLERQRQLDAFSEAARDRLLVIQREVAYSLGVVQDVGGFFDASRRVSRRQFREFVNPALKRNQEVQALLWVPRVTKAERGTFLARARAGFARFDIKERSLDGSPVSAAERPVHFPVLYVQPYSRNKDWLGLDLASDGNRSAVLNDAARARALRASLPEPVPSANGEESRFTVYLPVYERAGDEPRNGADAPESRGAKQDAPRLRGFAIGLFLVRGLVDQALANLGASGVDIYLYSSPEASPDQLFHFHSSRTRTWQPAQPVLPPSAAGTAEREYRGEIHVGDRRWTLIFNPVPGYFEEDSWSGYLILGGGVAFTLLSVVFLLTSRGRAEQVRRLVAQRTLELERSNTALNNEIAERRRAEQALQLLNVTLEQRVARRTAEAERRARELEQFAYVASHDLKAPLRAIGNLAGWLKDDLQGMLTAETGEQIELLRDRVARMHALVEGLLAYSRIGRTAGSEETVNTAELVADTIDSLAPPSGFKVKVRPGMPILYADKLHLGQVFANLIGNAISHHDRKTGTIQVSGEDLGDYCAFLVEDDGPGIPSEYRDKVFMMFQTLKVKDYGRDTGIGLALVKKLVEEHGGAVSLDSGPKRGSRFTFTWMKHEPRADSTARNDPDAD